MEYVIAIPSHRRPHILQKRTLAYLRKTNVDFERVILFLSDDQDDRAYPVCRRVLCPEAKNATDKFNAIHDYFVPGTPVVVMEDDIHNLCYRDDHARVKRQWVRNLDELIEESFDCLDGKGLWGINPHDSTHYTMMYTEEGAQKPDGKKYQFSERLNLIVAHFFGFISTRDPRLRVQEKSKTDYERSCLYYKYSHTVRRFDVGVKTLSYVNEGGMQADHTMEERREIEREACDNLVERFPDLLDYNLNKNSPFSELRFRYGANR